MICLDRLLYKNGNAILPFLSNPDFKFINADLREYNSFKEKIKTSDYVIILAGLVGDPITKKYPELSHSINLNGIKTLINELNKIDIKKLIFVSTCSNYGLIGEDELADESFVLNPISLYSKAKVEIEKYILSLKGKTNYVPTILRFCNCLWIVK